MFVNQIFASKFYSVTKNWVGNSLICLNDATPMPMSLLDKYSYSGRAVRTGELDVEVAVRGGGERGRIAAVVALLQLLQALDAEHAAAVEEAVRAGRRRLGLLAAVQQHGGRSRDEEPAHLHLHSTCECECVSECARARDSDMTASGYKSRGARRLCRHSTSHQWTRAGATGPTRSLAVMSRAARNTRADQSAHSPLRLRPAAAARAAAAAAALTSALTARASRALLPDTRARAARPPRRTRRAGPRPPQTLLPLPLPARLHAGSVGHWRCRESRVAYELRCHSLHYELGITRDKCGAGAVSALCLRLRFCLC